MKTLAIFFLAFTAAAQTADSLRANLAYLASDELAGRATPSPGLDLAANYIAAQFRAAGLTPTFQTARLAEAKINLDTFTLTLNGTLNIPKEKVRVRSLIAEDLADQTVFKLPANGLVPPIEGRIVAGDARRYSPASLLDLLQSRKPALILLIGPDRKAPSSAGSFVDDPDARHAPVIRIDSAAAAKLLHSDQPLSLTLRLAQPDVTQSSVRNVAAILPGSDPRLRDQYVILSAHYDHLGKTDKGIFHGANDDGSGTVSVIEIAKALAALPERPARSILFLTFFGEERGLLGSFYYTNHPLVPLKDTVADVNLEQLGRTDEETGKRLSAFGFTGVRYSDLPAMLGAAAKTRGVTIYKRADADSFFARSDNYPFALKGVVDTTIAVAFDYPDYHGLGDTLDKIDFDNLAKVDRAIAAGILRLAAGATPKWMALLP